MNDPEIVRRILKALERFTLDIEDVVKELKSINISDEDSYKISLSEKAKERGRENN